jgi:Helix-turn-helix domain
MTTYENGDPIISIMPVAVFLDHRLTANEIRVIGAILSFRNKDTGTCAVKRETLAQRCGLPLTKISTFTTSLVKKGWLVKEGSGGFSRASNYRVTVPELVTVTDPVTVTETVTTTVTESVTSTVTETVTGNEQSYEQSKNREEIHAPFGARKFLLAAGASSSLADDWLKVRKTKRLANTETAFMDFLAQVEKAGGNIDAVLRHCILKGWGGFEAEWLIPKGASHAKHQDIDNSAPAKVRRAIEQAKRERGEFDTSGCLEGQFERIPF